MGETTSQAAPGTPSLAGRLKYAEPRDLPSYPSSGLRPDGAAASAAASLGWSSQKPVEIWKPDKTSSASAAAVLAKDYKMAPSWEPDTNSAGHKAALLAVGSAGAALKQAGPDSNSKTQHDGWGNSAATQAFHANRTSTVQRTSSTHGSSAATQAFNLSRPAPVQQPVSKDGSSAATQAFNASRALSVKKPATPTPTHEDRSLAAAKGAMRPRAISTPSSAQAKEYHLEASAASSALSGAALAHRASLKAPPPSHDGGAVPVTTMTRNMFTSHPMVKPEVDEQQNNEKLHQSAVAMAKRMYMLQQKQQAEKEARGDGADSPQGGTYLNLQDAAYKQAHDRLAKLHNEHQQNREYQEYYGNAPSHKRRFSVANKLHRRSSSDGAMVSDRERSETIRKQMSMFSDKLSEIDKSKREKDREALLAAAQRNVKARLQGMDQKVLRDTGKVNPTLISDWEIKAQAAAQTRHETRTENNSRIDIGGGRLMTPDEINAIAAKRVQPVLDEINEKAEAERERQMVLKLEQEAAKAEQERHDAHEREVKEINRKVKEEDKQDAKARKEEEKKRERAKKEEDKAVKAEQKRLAKEEKRKSKPSTTAAVENDPVPVVDDEDTQEVTEEPIRPTIETDVDNTEVDRVKSPDAGSATSPTSPTNKVRGWIRNRWSRGKSVTEKGPKEKDGKRKSFLGGVKIRSSGADGSTASVDKKSSSMRDVAMAGKTGDETDLYEDSRGVSPVSSDSSELDEGGPSTLAMMPPKPIEDPVARKSSSSFTRDSRFKELMDR